MADIFISYAREDQKKARKLAQALADQGWSVWWDQRIRTGRRFHQVIERELAAARCVIALWSKAALSSYWVREEAQAGLDRDILVPASIESIPLPIGFRTVQTADLSDWNGNPAHSGFMRLVEDIRAVLGQASSQTPVPESEAKPERPAEADSSVSPVGVPLLDIESDQLREQATANAEVRPPARKPIVKRWEPYLALLGLATAAGLGYALHELRDHGWRPPPEQIFRDCDICPEMVVVPAGEFVMGSPPYEEGHDDDEGPQHPVRIPQSLAASRYEITFAEWSACVDAGGCDGSRSSEEGRDRGQLPVINMNWEDAKMYVAWLRRKTGQPYRLLAEAEWEYAARAGTTTRYWWGNEISPDKANYRGSGNGKATPVGSYPENPWKLSDMLGNVSEWVEDCYKNSYEGAPADGSAWITGNCSRRVVRGGSWNNDPEYLRSANRNGVNRFDRLSVIGFRVARALP